MSAILSYFDRSDYVEIDRLRIWDFYTLFPHKVKNIRLKRDEKDIKLLIQNVVKAKDNAYNQVLDDRQVFEKIRPYQMNALKCLASYGLINSDYISTNRIQKINPSLLKNLKSEPLSEGENNVIKLLTSHFYFMTLYGVDGLKQRTGLIEYKYDPK